MSGLCVILYYIFLEKARFRRLFCRNRAICLQKRGRRSRPLSPPVSRRRCTSFRGSISSRSSNFRIRTFFRSSRARTGGSSRLRRSRRRRRRGGRSRCNRGRRTPTYSCPRPRAPRHMFRSQRTSRRRARRSPPMRRRANGRKASRHRALHARPQRRSRRRRRARQTQRRSRRKTGRGGARSFHRTGSNRANTSFFPRMLNFGVPSPFILCVKRPRRQRRGKILSPAKRGHTRGQRRGAPSGNAARAAERGTARASYRPSPSGAAASGRSCLNICSYSSGA